MKTLSMMLGTALALGLASPAIAASADYYLIIDGVDGEGTTAAKIESWSFGTSRPATVTSGASGKSSNPLYSAPVGEGTNPLATTEHGVKSPRDAASGLATGRSSGGNVEAVDDWERADANRDGKIEFAEAAQVDQLGALSISLPPNSALAASACAKQGKTGKPHNGHIISSDGTVYDLSQMSIVCSGQVAGISGGAVAGIVIAASMKHTKTGHVTLMK